MLGERCDIEPTDKLLLLDTVGTRPGAALVEGERVVASAEFPGRSASAVVVAELRRMLGEAGWALRDLHGVGVVAGPGSFTGVRTGLATAKGLCEAAGLRMASVSRLEVLAEVARLEDGFAVLDAGRGAVYVREVRSGEQREWMESVAEFEGRAAGAQVVVAEEKMAALLEGLAPKLVELRPADTLRSVRRCLAQGGTNVEWADANYLLAESEIYGRPRAMEQGEASPR
jgi:tRNA threonylcarbamoyladenosine biosynthesis protein TsaB